MISPSPLFIKSSTLEDYLSPENLTDAHPPKTQPALHECAHVSDDIIVHRMADVNIAVKEDHCQGEKLWCSWKCHQKYLGDMANEGDGVVVRKDLMMDLGIVIEIR